MATHDGERPRRANHAFSLIELLVVVAILSLLVSIMVPSLTKAKELARGVLCLSNERAIAISVGMYATEHGGILPQIDKIDRSLEQYGISRGSEGDESAIWTCPTAPKDLSYVTEEDPVTYTFSRNSLVWVNSDASFRSLDKIHTAGEALMMADGRMNFSWGAWIMIDSTTELPYWNANSDYSFQNRSWFVSQGHQLSDSAYVPAADVDAPGGPSGIRYRHNQNERTGAAFMDGHAESRGIDQIIKRNFVTAW